MLGVWSTTPRTCSALLSPYTRKRNPPQDATLEVKLCSAKEDLLQTSKFINKPTIKLSAEDKQFWSAEEGKKGPLKCAYCAVMECKKSFKEGPVKCRSGAMNIINSR